MKRLFQTVLTLPGLPCLRSDPNRYGYRFGLGALLLVSTALVLPPGATAETTQPDRAALLRMAHQLVDSVDYNFGRADDYLDTVHGRENFKAIPDGEILLMQVSVGGNKGLIFNQPVLGIKRGDDVMISLFDFVSVAQFAIDVKPAEGLAEGWYIRANKKFRLDANTMTVTAEDRTYTMAEGDVELDEADIFVRGGLLAQIFQYQGDISLRYQRLDIQSAQKWPAIEKLERLRRRKNEQLLPPVLPRQNDPYQMASVPNVDVSTSYIVDRDGGTGVIEKRRSHNLVMAGDMAGHTLRTVVAGDDLHAVQSLSAAMKKESDQPDLLGRLKAREYQFGDINGVSVSGATGKRSGVGARVTNRSPYVTSDETTQIEGDIPPGWDVELYRGAQYIDMISAPEGSYRFEDVRLSGGENKFKIIKYGPLGEVEEEEVNIYSTPRALKDSPNLYDVSVNLSDTKLWTRQSADSDDQYTPIIAGTLEHRLTQDTSIKGGVATSQQDSQQKTYFHGGLATYIENTILNAGITADIDGAFLASTAARRRVLGQDMTASASFTGDNYGVLGDNSTPSSYTLGFLSRGSLPRVFDYSLGSYNFSTEYTENANDESQQISILTLSRKIAGLSFNHKFTHTISKDSESENQELNGLSAVMGTLWRTRWRAAAEYRLDPENTIDRFSLDLTRRLDKEWQAQVSLGNTPESDYTEAQAKLIWNNEHITLSPGISYDTDNNASAFVTANFGLAYDPYSQKMAMSGKKITDNGGISGFVYLDRDGDLTFSEGDEPIQDAVIEALHSNRKGSTDEQGEAFIHDIPDNILTDVKLNEYSLFDPLMVAGTEGMSILPRSGHTTRVEFPVHNGGELDGNVYIRMNDGKDRSAKNLRIHLHDLSGSLVQTATVSFDGFYLFQKIHPGEYWLNIDPKDAQNQGVIRPLPQRLSFGYEGTIIYGHKIFLRKAEPDEKDVPVMIGVDYQDYLALNPGVPHEIVRNSPIVLNLGEYNSRALMGVTWYRLKMFHGNLIRDGRLLVAPSESIADSETGLHSLRVAVPGLTLPEAWSRCRILIDRGLACGVEYLPVGLSGGDMRQAQLSGSYTNIP